MDSNNVYEQVQSHYGAVARNVSIKYGQTVAKAFGYTEEELATIPREANLGLSCGNPLAIANLRQGETVIDLGCGAGFDVFLAAKKVGKGGRVIGIDMNEEMLTSANKNKEQSGATNVEFVKSQITRIALQDGVADCVLSNCVVNLVPETEKPLVFEEVFRLLKAGGRLAISDILAKKSLPENMKKDVALYCGCISGASQAGEYESYLREAGFKDIHLMDNKADLNIYMDTNQDGSRCKPDTKTSSCCSVEPKVEVTAKDLDEESKPLCEGCSISDSCGSPVIAMNTAKNVGCCLKADDKGNESDVRPSLEDMDFNEWAGSYKIFAVKP